MKHAFLKKAVCFTLFLCLLPLHSLAGNGMRLRYDRKEHWIDGSRHVVYAQLKTDDAALIPVVNKINQAIRETANIDAYVNVLSTLQPGGTGLIVEDTATGQSEGFYRDGTGYFYVLMEAEGKMPMGRPAHHYYPMLFDLSTGGRVPFEQLFTDPDGAKAYIEQYLADVVEPHLSTYLENNQLFPVPYDSFGFSDDGHILIYYPAEQLSFLSGKSGAVAFRYSELWDYLDTSESGIPMQMVKTGTHHKQYAASRTSAEIQEILTAYPEGIPGLDHTAPSLGTPMEHVMKNYDISVDSGYYPGGAYIETETPELLGTYLITDANESYISGILTGRIDMYGIETGKTSLEEAKTLLGMPLMEMGLSQAAAEMYLVCPGAMAVYTYPSEFPIHHGNTGASSDAVSLTLYADENGLVQYVKYALE
ncbi:MAG: hypothetical protein E7324_10740 [Clostridiales bacterium]|nr:hypothetical protein [Clostridiales bacterium]